MVKRKHLSPAKWLFRKNQGTSLSRAQNCGGPGTVSAPWGDGSLQWRMLGEMAGDRAGEPPTPDPWAVGAGLYGLDTASRAPEVLPGLPRPQGSPGPSALWGSVFLSRDLAEPLAVAVW